MSATYTFPLAVPGAGGNGVTARGFAVRYAFAPTLDDAGDLVIEGSQMAAGVPVVEIVRNVLATDRGSCAGNPDLGPDYKVAQKGTANVAAAWADEVKRSLKFLVESKDILSLTVECDLSRERRVLLYLVSFVDPVSGEIHRVRGLVGV